MVAEPGSTAAPSGQPHLRGGYRLDTGRTSDVAPAAAPTPFGGVMPRSMHLRGTLNRPDDTASPHTPLQALASTPPATSPKQAQTSPRGNETKGLVESHETGGSVGLAASAAAAPRVAGDTGEIS